MSKFAEAFDRQQAFAAGFAIAARDWGLSEPEYQHFCKIAAEMMAPPQPVQPPAAPPTEPPAPPAEGQPIVPITDPRQADQARINDFVAQKAQALRGKPQQKSAAHVAPFPPRVDEQQLASQPRGAIAYDIEQQRAQHTAEYNKRLREAVEKVDRSFGGNRSDTRGFDARIADRLRQHYADMLERHPELARDSATDPRILAQAQADIAARRAAVQRPGAGLPPPVKVVPATARQPAPQKPATATRPAPIASIKPPTQGLPNVSGAEMRRRAREAGGAR